MDQKVTVQRFRNGYAATLYDVGVRLSRRKLVAKTYEDAMREAEQIAFEISFRVAQFTYFLQLDNADGFIKIGVADDPIKRMKDLQTLIPYPLRILKSVKGGFPLERSYHRRFAHLRGVGEWFSPAPDLMDAIDKEMGRSVSVA